jgi:hypothetical protein
MISIDVEAVVFVSVKGRSMYFVVVVVVVVIADSFAVLFYALL